MTMYNRMNIVLYKNYMTFLQCQVAKLPDETEGGAKNNSLHPIICSYGK